MRYLRAVLPAIAVIAVIASCAACSATVAGAPIERPQPSGPKIGPPHSSAPHPSEPAASTPTAGTARINFHAVQTASGSSHRATAMCRNLFAEPDAVQSLFKVTTTLDPITARVAQRGVLDCVYPTTGGTNPGLELQVGTKSAVYDPASNLALYANDIAIAADWDGNDSIDDVDKIRDYLQAVLDRISD